MSKSSKGVSRRDFVKGATAAAAFTFVPGHVLGRNGEMSPNEKLNIAFIGIAGRGGSNLSGLGGENIVGLCDVDKRRAAKPIQQHPDVKLYTDFRKMLDELDDRIDVVSVSTPDHTHAVAVMNALKRGKHVYCEKPLAHSIYEIRQIMNEARKQKVVTQLGNQGHSSGDIRKCCEWIWDGAIGNVHTVHAGCGANHCRISQLPKRNEKHDVPDTLDWDLWLGPAKFRPYNPMYLPGSWRAWTPFGSGTIGDWICHVVDPSFWALDLGAPDTVEAEVVDYDPKKHGDTFPIASRIQFKFPANDKRGPITLYWYNNQWKMPTMPGLKPKDVPGTGGLILGDEGGMVHGSHGAGGIRIFPQKLMASYKKPEETIPRTRGHHNDFLDAIRQGKNAGSNFDYGGPLTELARLGIIAMMLPGQTLEWDGPAMRFKNSEAANTMIKPPFREGWEV